LIKNSMRHLIISACAVLALTTSACQERNQKDHSKVNLGNKPDLLASHLDTTIKPGDDFFEYANGLWFKQNPIPASESGWGIFSLVEEENKNRILKISQDASANSGKKGSNSQLIGDFFSSGMDSAGIEKKGLSAIANVLSVIDKIATKEDVFKAIAQLNKKGIGTALSVSVYQDMKNSNKNMLYLSQGGLGMDDRDYYFLSDEQTTKVRNAYPQYVAQLMRLAGPDSLKAASQGLQVLAFETEIAKVHRPLEALRVPEKNYNKMSVGQLQGSTKSINWQQFFDAMGVKVDSVIVSQPEFLSGLAKWLDGKSIEDWKTYLRYHTLAQMAPYLNNDFVQAHFNFNGKLQGGAKEMRPRWKRVLDQQENALGDALGQLYVKEFFSEQTRKRYLNLTEAIVETYAEHIQKLDWMSDSTKQKALYKLKNIKKKVGYPDQWRDYSAMNIVRDNYAQNILSANEWQFNYSIAKLSKPVDRNEWDMTPQTYNAYYNPSNNEIVLPAAMFTAPGYTDNELDDALVYGYVGASTIGHELTHGFDDEGRKFDAQGNLVDWWSKSDTEQFSKRANKMIDQFNKYTVLGNKHPNGAATLGENIADQGGVVIGYDAFKKTKQFKENQKLGGLTPAQRYFLGYAYGWMQVRTNERLAQQLLSDVHAPIMLRVNGPISNCDAWYEAFNVQRGQKMFRDSLDRVRIW
jgi:putative endopeptidase